MQNASYKEGQLVYNKLRLFRVQEDIASAQAEPLVTTRYYRFLGYDDAAVLNLLRLTSSTDPATPQSLVPTASWGLQQVGTVFSLLRDATQIPLPAGTRNTLLNPVTGEAFTPTSAVNATTSPFMGVKDGGSLTFNKPVAQVCFYDKDLRFVSSAGTISASIVAPATAYYVRLVALTEDGPDTGRTGVSSVYSTVTYSLDELPYVTGIQLPGGNIVRPNAVGVVDGSQLGSGSPGGTARYLGDVPTQKVLDVIAAYAANGGPVEETDPLYFGQEFNDDETDPGNEWWYVCRLRRVKTGSPVRVWKWGRFLEAGV